MVVSTRLFSEWIDFSESFCLVFETNRTEKRKCAGRPMVSRFLADERPATVFSMRRSITAVASVVVALAAVGCSGGGGGSSLASTTTTPVVTTAPAATTTEAPSTTAAPTTTTTTALITDATTADPKALAAQLQAVLDRYQALYIASRTDPERPFTDQKLIDDLHEVAEQAELASLVQWWNQKRAEGSAARAGTSVDPGPYLSGLTRISASSVTATYCLFDDRVSYVKATGQVLDDSVAITRGVITFDAQDGSWLIRTKEAVSAERAAASSPNPCPNERVS
jgi:hypothetical protein